MAQIPEKLVNFRCYGGSSGNELIGLTDVELPKFDAMTETIMGAGIAGEYDSPVIGHFKSLVAKLNFRTVTNLGVALLAPVYQILDIRGSIQTQDPSLGQLATVALRFEVRGQTKSGDPGKLEPGKPMASGFEIECATVRISLAGKPVLALDKFNMSYIVNGVDYLRGVRQDLGGV